MINNCRAWLVIGLTVLTSLSVFAQIQDKEQSKAMVDLAGEMLKASQAEDDVRDIMVQAADLDTTNILANFEAARLHLRTIKKEEASKYLLRIYRQKPNYRFDLEYHIAASYQYGLQFDRAIEYYNRYKLKYQRQPNYQGKDKVSLGVIERKIYECNNGKEFVANPKPWAIVNIGPQVNSEYNDYAPVLNEKEDEIIFTSRRLEGNLNENVYSDNKPYEDIFFSTKGANGKWTRAANIGRTVNIPNHNSNLALSPDGKTLFSYRDDNGGDIFVSELRPDNTWSTPKPLPGVVNSPYMESSVTITPDGNTIYFASERDGGYGGLDIYVCTKDARGNWSKVRNLGPTINTEGHEDGPFIDYSAKKLYFSSEGHKGMGGYDIFETNLINPARNEWSEPVNVGFPINTPDNDIYFVGTADGKRGYYASVRDDGLGYLDIYTIGPKEQVQRPTTVLPVKLVVKVIDAKDNTPLQATIELLSIAESKPVPLSAQTKGNYTFTVTTKDPKNYRLSVRHEGYFPQVEEITLQSADVVEKTITRTVGMAKSKKDPVIVPLKYVVKIVDSKTNAPIEATVKLQSTPDNTAIVPTAKGAGAFEFSIITPNAKAYQLSVERSGYASQSQPVNLEGAGMVEKIVNKTVALVETKPLTVPLKYQVKVVDSKTNQPIDANVKLESQPEKIAIAGTLKGVGTVEFTLSSTTPKDYNLTVDKSDYEIQTQLVNIEAAGTVEKNVVKTVVLVKKPPVLLPIKLTVKVVDEKTNSPLDARLKLETVGEAPVAGATLKTTGLFDFSVKPGTSKEYTLTAERDGYTLKSEKFMVEAAGPTAKTVTRTITLAEIKKEPVLLPVTLSIKIIDEKTKAPLDARLKLESVGDAALTGLSPKATGQFDFTVKPTVAKEYTLTAERDGYTLKSEKFMVEAAGPTAKTVTRTITLAEIKKEPVLLPISVSIKVIDEKTKAPLDARLKLESVGDAALTGLSPKATGQFDFTVKPTVAKEYTITAERDGYVLKSEKFMVEAAGPTAKTVTRTITLTEIKKEPVLLPITLSIKVIDEKTKAPLDARLKLESVGDAALTGLSPKATGQFDFTVKPTAAKEYTITAERDGYTLKSEKFMVEAAGPTTKTFARTITLAEIKKEPVLVPLKLTVKVLDEKTNLPIDAKLKLETVGQSPQAGSTIKTTGLFDFSVMQTSPKEYTLTIERDGYTPKSEKFTIEAAGTSAKAINRTVMLKPVVQETAPLPTSFVRVVVNVYDRKTNAPLEARVILETMADDMEINATPKGAGVYEFIVTSTKTTDYELSADREGYVYTTQKIRIEGATDKEKTLNRTLTLQPIAVGVTSVLRNLYFDVGKASIRPESYAELNGFRNMMQDNPSIRVEISGHTDNVGDDTFNKNLSQLRANAVKTYLTSKGIDPKRLVAIGYGETRPLVSNDDEDGGREINRRVELKILSK